MHFVTGGTGLLGSHIVEQLVQRGEKVRALVRPGSNVAYLQSLGVELREGDLSDEPTLRLGMKGAAVVYHSAAKVGDWGRWQEFQRDGIDGTRNILTACHDANVGRLVYVSSVSAYGHPKPGLRPITEEEPLGTKFWLWDNYTRAKVMAERILWDFQAHARLPLSVIRPGWLYGPRDRTSIFRVADSLRRQRTKIVGGGANRINSIYAGNVAEACLIAGEHPDAVGQAFNVCNDGYITQIQYMNLYADALGYPRPKWHVPYSLAYTGAFFMEAAFRLVGARKPPWLTRYATWLVGRNTYYSTEKAQRVLGWKPRVGYEEGIRRTVDWYRSLKKT